MMNLFPVLVATGAVFGLMDAATVDYYASKYDHIDVETILNNRRMVNYYAVCLLSKGPCPPEGLEFKRLLPEALRTNCQRCTEKQKTVTLRAIRRLKKEYPKIWTQLEALWDPEGIYVTKFESTFAGKPSEVTLQASPQVSNRFSGTENDNKSLATAISEVFSTPLSSSTTTSTTASRISTSTPSTTSSRITTSKTTTTTSRVSTKPSTKTTTFRFSLISSTNKPNINTISASTKPTKRPRPNIGARIQATVSLGTNIVGDLVRGLGVIGNRVVETGAEIAGVVLKNIARPL